MPKLTIHEIDRLNRLHTDDVKPEEMALLMGWTIDRIRHGLKLLGLLND